MYIYNLAQKFKTIVAENEHSTAVVSENCSLSYKQLDEQSDAFAAYLLHESFEPGDVVCISGQKETATIAMVLGSLKCGVTYSIFDPDSPFERLSKIFDRCRPKLIVCSDPLSQELKSAGYQVRPAEIPTTYFSESASLSQRGDKITGSQAAYIMFTSGSTGFPKGATMTHGNVLNLIEWSRETYNFAPGDVLTNVNPLYFDNSVFDLYSALFTGSTLALFSAETVRNPARLLHLIDEFKCTSWFSVPSMLMFLQAMRALKNSSFKHISRIIFGGEGYPKAKLKELFDLFSDRITLYNVYGPTECTCICSSYVVSGDDFSDLAGFLPLGQLIPNFDFRIIDENLTELAPGQLGELVLRGPNVGLGYYRDPERTAAAFIQDPRNGMYNEFVYRTGDLVCFNPEDGKLHINGRRDNQIKHMGYRIELEEIENALSCVNGVKQSAVVHAELKGLSNLIAFLQCDNQFRDEKKIKAALQTLLPQYMIPTRIVFMDLLPKNANGKLDRISLKQRYLGELASV